MKKILIAFDGLKYSDSAVEYAVDIAKGDNALLVGVFLHDMSYLAISYTYRWASPLTNIWEMDYKPDPADEKKIKTNVAIFSNKCEEMGIRYKVHVNRGVPVEELLQESAYADLMIIDARLAFRNVTDDEMSAQFIEMLTEVQCPVLVTPSKFEKIDNVILTYDGSPSTTYAIRMYSYIFPEWRNLPTRMVTVKSEDLKLTEKHNIHDLLLEHFPSVETVILTGNPRKELLDYLKKTTNNTLVVMGAYGRPAISMLFKKSLANSIIRDVMVPVLIAHP
jgi:nucleotide-binding universal stress UspA family protein